MPGSRGARRCESCALLPERLHHDQPVERAGLRVFHEAVTHRPVPWGPIRLGLADPRPRCWLVLPPVEQVPADRLEHVDPAGRLLLLVDAHDSSPRYENPRVVARM